MTALASMSGQATGMPVVASFEPHRPGAIRRYLQPEVQSRCTQEVQSRCAIKVCHQEVAATKARTKARRASEGRQACGQHSWAWVDLGWPQVDLGWPQVDLGWPQVDLGEKGVERAWVGWSANLSVGACVWAPTQGGGARGELPTPLVGRYGEIVQGGGRGGSYRRPSLRSRALIAEIS